MQSWKDIWTRKGEVPLPEGHTEQLLTLMKVGGYDTSLGGASPDQVRQSAAQIHQTLRLNPDSRLLDVGCGAGAVLFAMEDRPEDYTGVDYSPTSLELARAALPGIFLEAEAASLPFADASFDAAYCLGVYLYFPDEAYAQAALREMVRVICPGGRGMVMDIMDSARRTECERARAASYPPGEYEKRFEGLIHLYLDREWIHAELDALGCDSWDVPFYSDDYGYRDYVFHVAFERRPGTGAEPRRLRERAVLAV